MNNINGRQIGHGKITRDNILRCIEVAGIQGNFETYPREAKIIADTVMTLLDEESKHSDLTRTITLPPPDEGYRWSDEPRLPKAGDVMLRPDGSIKVSGFSYSADKYFVMEKIRRTYDWLKTSKEAHVQYEGATGFFRYGNRIEISSPQLKLADHWQAHNGGECPIDADSCIVSVRLDNGKVVTDVQAFLVNWACVTSWKFERLIDGVDWS
jgi:hypothetical protein